MQAMHDRTESRYSSLAQRPLRAAARKTNSDQLEGFMSSSLFNPVAAMAVCVAQVSNLLYRRASSLQGARQFRSQWNITRLPIGNRRYSRLETCATPVCGELRYALAAT